ncbi:hypothetical protein [Enterococcus sp. AZ072]|uniref:hypothetical protein n=1 Tax=unclassified Enterococcus TaxID=2608891 RepID=UPI003D28502A
MAGKTIEKVQLKERNDSEMLSRNLLTNAWWTNRFSHWEKLGEELVLDEDDQGWMNLSMDSEGSAQLQQSLILKENHCYFIMFDVKVTRYVSGLFGVQVNGRFVAGSSRLGLRRKTKNKGYETITGIVKTGSFPSQEYTLSVGSMESANGAGNVRRLSVYDLTAIYQAGNEPTAEAFLEALPDTQDEFGVASTGRQLFAALDTKINRLSGKGFGASDREAHAAFLKEMNQKACEIGMEQTKIENMHGFKVDGQVSTAKDFLKLGIQVLGSDKLVKIWGTKDYTVRIEGGNSRKETVKTTLRNAFLEEKYTVLGGKTGTIGRDVLDVITLTVDPSSGDLYLAVVMGATGVTGENDRFEAVHQLITACKNKSGNVGSEVSLKATSGMALRVPNGNPLYYTNQLPNSTIGIHETQVVTPAALSKVMTALLLVENIQNLNEIGMIVSSDITGGSGPRMFEGDRISFKDALYLLFLASSNTAAKFISREVGHRIIQMRENLPL